MQEKRLAQDAANLTLYKISLADNGLKRLIGGKYSQ